MLLKNTSKKNKMKKKEKMNNLNCALPHDLVVDILLRLPVRSLVRFKCVSTSWLCLISNPQFAESHFDLAASPTHRLLLNRINAGSEIQSLDLQASLHNDSAVVTLKFPAPNFRTLGSSRGFLLLAKELAPSLDDLILWNPSTGCHRKILLSYDHWDSWYDPSSNPNISPFNLLHSDLHGFGYDPSKDDYLLVVIRLGKFHPPQWTNKIGVLSVKTNVTSFYGDGVEYMAIGSWAISGLYLNQSLHWSVFSMELDDVIIAFDLVEKSLSEIPLSPLLFEELLHYDEYHLGILGGCLSLGYSAEALNFLYGHERTEIWVMKEYKVQDSWTKTLA